MVRERELETEKPHGKRSRTTEYQEQVSAHFQCVVHVSSPDMQSPAALPDATLHAQGRATAGTSSSRPSASAALPVTGSLINREGLLAAFSESIPSLQR